MSVVHARIGCEHHEPRTAEVRTAALTRSWTEIGAALGVSKQAAHQRFAERDAVIDEFKAARRANPRAR